MELLGLRTVPFRSHVTFLGGGFPLNVQLIVIMFPLGNVELKGKIEVIIGGSTMKR